MKTLLCSAAFVLSSLIMQAQNNSINPYPKTINVNGSAEVELVPDEIYVQVDLKEYEKKGSSKVDLEKIKTAFLKNVKNIGIPDSLVTIASYDGFNGQPYWQRKKRKDELYASIAYQIKFTNSKKIDELVAKLDDDATQNFYIVRTTHSKLAEYRKNLKIQAVRAAKEKGAYLSEAIGERLGEAVTISEPQEYYHQPYENRLVSNSAMRRDMVAQEANDEEVVTDFKKIKLRYDVQVTFALK